mmetsp:Transcript_25130/g.68276  ORF Transcript_25130/g.68276 Transcript_25130/m.68276 type:complete len:311 (+) Transcript_25130:1069-2001(+)
MVLAWQSSRSRAASTHTGTSKVRAACSFGTSRVRARAAALYCSCQASSSSSVLGMRPLLAAISLDGRSRESTTRRRRAAISMVGECSMTCSDALPVPLKRRSSSPTTVPPSCPSSFSLTASVNSKSPIENTVAAAGERAIMDTAPSTVAVTPMRLVMADGPAPPSALGVAVAATGAGGAGTPPGAAAAAGGAAVPSAAVTVAAAAAGGAAAGVSGLAAPACSSCSGPSPMADSMALKVRSSSSSSERAGGAGPGAAPAPAAAAAAAAAGAAGGSSGCANSHSVAASMLLTPTRRSASSTRLRGKPMSTMA